MRRTLTVVLALVLVVGACSKPERPALERVTGEIGPSGTNVGDDPTTGSDGAGTSSSSTVPVPSDPGTSGDTPSPPAVADALTRYFDALQAEDFATARRVSTGSARFMAGVRDVVARYNAERDGVTTLKYSARSFRVGFSDATRVAYVGTARLDSTVSGPAGDPHSESALFENPVVSFERGGWFVSDFSYDGEPVDLYPSTASEKVGGVALHLEGALSFANDTGIVIDLVTDASHAIKVENVRLSYADGSTATPTLGALVSTKPAALYYLFARTGATPVAWTATVTIDADTPSQASEAVVLRF